MGKKIGLSWKRLSGISGAKNKLSRKTVVPLTKGGRQKKIKRAFGCCVILAILFGAATIFSEGVFADLVHLKDGRKLEGEIVSETKDTIRLKMALGEMSIKREEIKEIEKKPWTPPEKPTDQETPEKKKQKEIARLIKKLHKKFYQKFALVSGEYLRLPDFDLRYKSSKEVKGGGKDRRWVWIEKVGDFGEDTRGDFKVLQILGENEVLIWRPIKEVIPGQTKRPGDRSPWLTRKVGDLILRIKGFSTKTLVDDAKWKGHGQPIAAIGTWQYTTTTGGTKTVLNCIPLEQVKKGLTIEQFKEMLKVKGIEENNLSELVKGKKDSEILALIKKGMEKDKKPTQEPPKGMTAKKYYERAQKKRVAGDLDGAIADFTIAIELKPDYADAWLLRGLMKETKGDLDGALSDYTKIIEFNPRHAVGHCHRVDAYINRARVRERNGDIEGTKADKAKAQERK
jgi:hypothetical protein